MKIKKLIVALLLCCMTLILGGFAACMATGTEQKKEERFGFLEGVITEVEFGKEVKVEELIDTDADFEFYITDPEGVEKEYTFKTVWIPDVIGEYVLTYKVGSQTATHTVKIIPRDVHWEYDNKLSLVYELNETLTFDDFFTTIKMHVKADTSYTLAMDSVRVNGKKTDLKGQSAYTFKEVAEHWFRMRVDTEDGQYLIATFLVDVQYLEESAQAWLEEYGVSYHNYISIMGDRSVKLNKSTYALPAKNVQNSNFSYISFDGEYGLGDYVTFDFTGKNLPQMCFFAKESTPNIVDGKDGLFIANGLQAGNPEDRNRYTFYGPRKIEGKVFGGSDRVYIERAAPIGYNYLDEDAHYRYIAGVSKVLPIEVEKEEEKATYYVPVMQFLLLDLDKGEKVYDREIVLTNLQSSELGIDYYKGNIVAYGTIEEKTAWDKVYPVRHANDISELYQMAEFVENCPKNVPAATPLQVSDYVQDKAGDLYVENADGVRTEVTGDTFTLPTAGAYRLYYYPTDTSVQHASIVLSALSNETSQFMQENSLTDYCATYKSQGKNVGVSFPAGKTRYEGPTGANSIDSVTATDVPYVAFNKAGGYGAGSYVAVDFTGDNMPNLSFFTDMTGSVQDFNNRSGALITQGFTRADGKFDNNMVNRYYVYAPFKKTIWSNGITLTREEGNGFAYATLTNKANANAKYRYIFGFDSLNAATGTVNVTAIMLKKNGGSYQVVDSIINRSYTSNLFKSLSTTGGIVVYGRTYKATSIDKLYPVYTDKEALGAALTEWTGSNPLVWNGPTVLPQEAATFRTENSIKDYYAEYTYANGNVGVTLSAGSHTYTGTTGANSIDSVTATDVPYVAFNKEGGYGVGNYVAVDFTGNNMPHISFFTDMSGKVEDYKGRSGAFVTQGFIRADGAFDNNVINRYYVYAPFNGTIWSNGKTFTAAAGNAFCYSTTSDATNATAQYRYIFGFDSLDTTAGTITVTAIMLKKNGDRYETLQTLQTSLTDKMFKSLSTTGGIVIYGRAYKATTLDKIHPIYTESELESALAEWTKENSPA